MTTVLEQSTTPFNDRGSTRRQPEIIDVDLFDSPPPLRPPQLPSSSRHVSRPVRQQPETISLLDSDDEADDVRPSPASRSIYQWRERYSSPPPVPDYFPIPPMPALPAQYAGHTSFPMPRLRRDPVRPVPPIVRPIQEPFGFERNLSSTSAGPSRQRNNNQRAAPVPAPPPPRAAAPSHHQPAMGFGGALLSQRARLPRNRLSDYLGTIPLTGRFSFAMHSDNSQVYLNLGDNENDEGYVPRLFRTWAIRRGPDPTPAAAARDKYMQHFTHPAELEPGFTADFAPTASDKPQTRLFPPTSADQPIIVGDDEPSTRKSASSSKAPQQSSLSALLVCAHCMSPLLLNAAMSEEDAKEKRVWGLRCGHLLDGKCLSKLGYPEPVPEDLGSSSKGKARGKGKGKAKAVDTPAYGETVEANQQGSSSIRSRLRTKPSGATFNSADAPESSSTQTLDSLSVAPPPAKRRKVAAKKPKVEAEYEWKCPVASCKAVHVSVKVDGVWGPQRDHEGVNVKSPTYRPPRGAIPVFA